MFYDFLHTKHIYIVCGKTDLRKGIDGLASLIQQDYQLDLYEDAVFLSNINSITRIIGTLLMEKDTEWLASPRKYLEFNSNNI